MIQIYDTMTKNLRPFEPLIANNVSMYVCGPTVYNYIHLGNARSIIAFDTVRRYFEYRGYDVNFVLISQILMIRLSLRQMTKTKVLNKSPINILKLFIKIAKH